MCKLLIAFLLATSALAADEHDFIAKNFRFHDGETMAKPSDGLCRKFPHYDYADMIDLSTRSSNPSVSIIYIW